MAAAQLTDEELLAELNRLGCSPGPVTESTRPVYLKKLKKLREEQQKGSRTNKTRSGGAAGASAPGARPASRDVTRMSASGGRSSGGRLALNKEYLETASKPLLGFSSDESDAEVNQKGDLHSTSSRRRDRSSGQHHHHHYYYEQLRPAFPSNRNQRLDVSSDPNFDNLEGKKSREGSPFWLGKRKCTTDLLYSTEPLVNGEINEEDEREQRNGRGLSSSRFAYSCSKPQEEYSDSEEDRDEEDDMQKQHHPRSRRLSPRRSLTPSELSAHKSARGLENCQERTGGGVSAMRDKYPERSLDEVESIDWRGSAIGSIRESASRRPPYSERKADLSANVMLSSPTLDSNHVDLGSFSSFTKPRVSIYNSFTDATTTTTSSSCGNASVRTNHSNHTISNHVTCKVPQIKKLTEPEEELLQQFKGEEVSATSGVSAHYLSMFLLTAACLFFVLLGLLYLRMRGSGSVETAVAIKSHPFGSDFDRSYGDKEKSAILNILLHLHDHLAKIAGEHDCGDHLHRGSRNLTFKEASDFLSVQNISSEENLSAALEWIIKSGESAAGIRLIGRSQEEDVKVVSDIKYLESTHPNMSFICRFRRAFVVVINRMLLFVLGIGIVLCILWYMKYRWKKEAEETKQMYDMVGKIIDVLRSHHEACQENKDLQPYLPIPHVRDSLIKPQNRKKMKKVWDRAVHFLSTNESRMRTQTERIGGADFLVWKWIQPSLACDKIPSKVWQGKAFPLDKRNSPPNSLTPCLKIRNMFDPVMEVGETWDLAIHEAILEKCSDNDGIVHIAVDKNSREGCVYVKCLSAEHAGKAFKALHGSWFDGKLVTVKYLRLDRYHQRFPQALNCSTPLKPSDNFLNTVSHLRHRTSTINSVAKS
ncbi:inner nuclear membrane protein Man1 [Erpetoichthys calabaricus]|uniref:Inner nuclear membrane protein Man1 n=1 Tax=Erpetoichthys calabaricus TaxID=27687 RepID=A0A8C4RGJ6_ERPCA|nr:inner nuclear membrane protein Man1 [Erpetoichthys calabaricus]